MKKFLLLVFTLLLIGVTAAKADTLVVYFSCTGKTETVAMTAAEVLGADLWQIVPVEPYSDADLNYNIDSCRANMEQNDSDCRPAFVGEVDITDYDTILVAYPIWWGEEPRIIDTWIECLNLSGKRMAAMCTSGGSGIQTSYAHLQSKAPDANWLGAKRFAANASTAEMAEWCASVGLEKDEETTMMITIGEHTLYVRMDQNPSADTLLALLADGPLTISASNYGGFEKVCPLGTRLPSSDEYTVTHPGDVMLYASSNIVIFHGSNSWEYTRLGWIEDTAGLTAILSGHETEITLSLK